MQQFKFMKFVMAALPLLEIAGFIIVGSWIGVLATLFLIIATTALGFFILRIQGFVTLHNMQQRMAAGEHPAVSMMQNSLLMIGGFLLVLPGFITDTLGLILLIPTVRKLLLSWMIKKGSIQAQTKQEQQNHTPDQGRIIDGDFHREDDDT